MAMKRIHIKNLAPYTVARSNGALAQDNLKPYLQINRAIEVDLSGEYPLSLSFLDELVRKLAESGDLEKVTFAVRERDVLRKLSRVAEIRGVNLVYLDAKTGARGPIKPRPAARYEVVTIGAKPEERIDRTP